VDILSAVEDIHMMLDDNILKAQAMRSSSYIKAFDTEMQAWETKLISMQDILDAWLEVITTYICTEISNNL
jgi:dynein heavy chain